MKRLYRWLRGERYYRGPYAKILAQKRQLKYHLDIRPKNPLAIGKGNVLHLTGWCYHTTETIRRLNILVDNKTVGRVQHYGLPRTDVLREASKAGIPAKSGLNSGFIADIPIGSIDHQKQITLAFEAILGDGEIQTIEIGQWNLTVSHVVQRLLILSATFSRRGSLRCHLYDNLQPPDGFFRATG